MSETSSIKGRKVFLLQMENSDAGCLETWVHALRVDAEDHAIDLISDELDGNTDEEAVELAAATTLFKSGTLEAPSATAIIYRFNEYVNECREGDGEIRIIEETVL